MKIAQSTVNLSASRYAEQRHEQRETLNVWRDPPASPNVRTAAATATATELPVHSTGAANAASDSLLPHGLTSKPQRVRADISQLESMPDSEDFKLVLLKRMIERLTGRDIEIFDPAELAGTDTTLAVEDPSSTNETPQRQGWGMVYDYYQSYYESEQVSFSAEAVVQTADGREIAVNVELTMSREFYEEQRISLRAGDALKDPLVINFSGTAAQLTQRDFSFDLDLDGHEDQIAFVAPGSGFLVLDSNGDGQINDGSELFGPRTGAGFAELAAHDEDGNGWIDEQDSVYERLRIWSRDASGQTQLLALGERGVGAIYLGSVDSAFDLNDASNATLGRIQKTGIYLGEDGNAGTIQQLDLVV